MRRKLVRGADGKISFVDLPDTPEYFFPMGEPERKLVADWVDWVKKQKGKTEKQKEFLKRVKKAVKVVKYDYSIATIEPSQDENGKIYYEVNKPVLIDLAYDEWLEKAKEFMPNKGSDLATLHELFLWYAYRIAKGKWTLSYVCDNSSKMGNYWNTPKSAHECEPSGARKVGDFADGVGNTFKIVKDPESGFLLCGGSYMRCGNDFPLTNVVDWFSEGEEVYSASGCIVLRKQ